MHVRVDCTWTRRRRGRRSRGEKSKCLSVMSSDTSVSEVHPVSVRKEHRAESSARARHKLPAWMNYFILLIRNISKDLWVAGGVWV